MLRLTWRAVLARKVRLALSAFAVVLGVGFVAGSFIFTDAMGDAFDGIIEGSTSDVEVAYQGAGDFGAQQDSRLIPASVVERLRRLPEAARVNATTQLQTVYVLGRDRKVVGGNGPPGLAFNHTGARSLTGRPILTRTAGRYPRGGREVALDVDTARKAGYRVGQRLTVVTPGDPPSLRVRLVGLVEFGSGGLNGATLTVFDRQFMQQAFFGGRDAYTSVSLTAADGVSQEQLRDAARRVLPDQVEARTGDAVVKANQAGLDKILGYLNTFLLVFAAVALVVGSYLIVNTFSILVAQRSRELALLRAMGASRRQVDASVLLESFVVGVFASTLGLGLGYLLARGLQLLFGVVGFDLSRATFPIEPRTVVASYLVGILVTCAAAYLPARRASGVPPVAALRDDVALPESSLRRRVVLGLVLVVGGIGAMYAGVQRGGDPGLRLLGAGALGVLLGVSLLSPWLGRPVTKLFEVGYRRLFGTVGVLAAQNSLRNPRRTAATASALMIGLTLVSLIAVLGRSASASTDAAIERTVTSQFVVSSVVNAPFPTSVAGKVRRVDGVLSVEELRTGVARLEGRRVYVGSLDPRALQLALTLRVRAGTMLALRPGTLAMATSSAARRGLTVGDTVTLRFQAAPVRLKVVALFEPSNALPTSYLVTHDALRRGGLVPQDTLLFVTKRVSADPTDVRRDVKAAVRDLPTVTVQDPAELAQQQRANIDLFLNFLYALLGLALVIAVLGIVNTLALSVVERTREVGLLRAVGVSRAQLRRMVRLESVVVAVLGAALGVVMGVAFGVALQRVLADEGVDVLSVPWLQLVVFVVLAAVAGVLAAVLPARRAARLDVLHAIATE